MLYVYVAIAVIVVAVILTAALLVVPRLRRFEAPPAPPVEPPVADDTAVPREASTAVLPPPAPVTPTEPVAPPALETPEPTAGRLLRLRARLARSQTSLGRGLLSVLARERLDDDAWEEVEEALLTADVGVGATTEIVERLRTRTKVLGTRSTGELRALLADELVAALQPDLDRTLHSTPTGDRPAVVLVVGVNGTGKTT
ncbi:MAG TPA: signal recognition particle receptor subunit alpha, partial [Jatrophihabitans sp.]|nr:signal recognition particle receptor subunit alpha [Jatrophihabitans sp.]